ncbi:Signal recognition particle subunit srp14 [Lachnellula suecica]|uniref:Signal recognition particle subunit SRP14 n=1 Tax=Lachnellula suecica TaxID=602035 RepID=A0A8T9C6C9_9HELO|nr:Signal recognition particle subunit srp14 [Lachnellula suecica]
MSKSLHSSNDDFFQKLSELFESSTHGSIYLTQKCMAYGAEAEATEIKPVPSEQFPDLNPSAPLPLIIRATNGKSKQKRDEKIKLSTIVEADAMEGFFGRYAEVCKTRMSGLKKRDRSKAKEKLKAKKRKQGGAAAAGVGKKKGRKGGKRAYGLALIALLERIYQNFTNENYIHLLFTMGDEFGSAG